MKSHHLLLTLGIVGLIALAISPLASGDSYKETANINVSGKSGIAVAGFDPVAFFTLSEPTHGDPGIAAQYEGATYFFANEEHKQLFEGDPKKYAPQYGGYCAYGVAVGALFPVDISTWQIHEGKLYLNLNPAILDLFNQDIDSHIEKAEQNWPKL